MSRELREKAEVMEKELKELLVPISDEIRRIKNTGFPDSEKK